MPIFTNNDVSLHYEIHGEGKPIIFTHGASWNHKQWLPQVQFFSNYYQTITWDVRGHGYSHLPEGKVNSDDFINDLIALLDHLNIESASLCGLSMGGHISLQTAARHPERVESLILFGTPFTNSFNWYEKIFVPVNRFSTRLVPMKLSGKMQAAMLSKFNSSNKDYIEEAFAMLNKKNWSRVWDAVTRMESRADLEKIKCPTLLLQGDHDTMTMRQQKTMLTNIQNAKLQLIQNAHHATNLDNPHEVNNEIHKFLVENQIK